MSDVLNYFTMVAQLQKSCYWVLYCLILLLAVLESSLSTMASIFNP